MLLLGRNGIEAAVALLACFHRGAVAAPLPPMFGARQLAALAGQAGAKAVISFGGETEHAKCGQLSSQVPVVLALRPGDITGASLAARHGPAFGERGRPRGAAAFFRYDVAAQGHYAFQQYPALRGRARRPPLGAHGARPASRRLRVRLRRQPRLRVPGGPAVRGHRGAAAALERRGRAAPDRGSPLHVRAVHADARRGRPAGRTAVHAGLVKPAGPRGNRSIPGTPDRDERDFRPSAAGRLRALRGPRARCARPFGAVGEDDRDRGTALPRHRDQDP